MIGYFFNLMLVTLILVLFVTFVYVKRVNNEFKIGNDCSDSFALFWNSFALFLEFVCPFLGFVSDSYEYEKGQTILTNLVRFCKVHFMVLAYVVKQAPSCKSNVKCYLSPVV